MAIPVNIKVTVRSMLMLSDARLEQVFKDNMHDANTGELIEMTGPEIREWLLSLKADGQEFLPIA